MPSRARGLQRVLPGPACSPTSCCPAPGRAPSLGTATLTLGGAHLPGCVQRLGHFAKFPVEFPSVTR